MENYFERTSEYSNDDTYFLKVSPDYLTTIVDDTSKYLLGYITDYQCGQLLISFEHEGELVEYLDCDDGDIIVDLRLPNAYVTQDENGVYYDRALNKCVKWKMQTDYIMYALGKFGMEKIYTSLNGILLKQ